MAPPRTPRKRDKKLLKNLEKQVKDALGVVPTSDVPNDCDDKYTWDTAKIRATFIRYLDTAYNANRSRIHVTIYKTLRNHYETLGSTASFSKVTFNKGRAIKRWTYGNLPSYRRWSTSDASKAQQQLTDAIGTFIELIPVGCQIPKPFTSKYGLIAPALRDLVAVPNGLDPMVLGGESPSLNVKQSDASDSGDFVNKKKRKFVHGKKKNDDGTATPAKKIKTEPDLPQGQPKLSQLDHLLEAINELSCRNIDPAADTANAKQDRENARKMVCLLAETLFRGKGDDNSVEVTPAHNERQVKKLKFECDVQKER